MLAGCLLWSIIPGHIARALPESWHMPEKIATRVLREPSIWEAGVRLLHVGSPEAWRAISDAAEMRHRNRAAVEDCEKRSEEHTSELQSLMRTSYAVFCLKTKTKTNTNTNR